MTFEQIPDGEASNENLKRKKNFQVQGMPTAKAPGVIQKLTRCSAHLYLCIDDCFDDNTFRTLLAENITCFVVSHLEK